VSLDVACAYRRHVGAKELVKERTIFHRERAINLRVGAYFTSKLVVLAAISVVQVTLLWEIVQAQCGLPGSSGRQWLTLTVLAVAGTTVGLLISALARSEELATALVPIVVIPQIILTGLIVPLEDGPRLARWIAKGFVAVFWAREALERLLPDDYLALIPRTKENWRNPLAIIVIHLVAAAAFGILVLLRSQDKTQ
jgi:ABC-type multidrug transport system permease subunit